MNLLDFINDLEAKEAEEKAASVPTAPPVLSVSQISSTLKNTVEQIFADVKVEGEISGFKQAASGHMYFNLKDDKAVLNAVVWRGMAAQLTHRPVEGQQVIATGRLTTYPARSNYQITVNHLEPAGQGTLLAQLEALKKKLFAEGLFDEDKKRPIPYLPTKIGIITSPTGAVIDDMLHRISARCPRPVVLAGVAVQGAAAPREIIKAIQGFNALPEMERSDVLIIARGGGSLEDLMAFNDEQVVRAVAGSGIPTISGVGHEPDTTLCDYAADKRAPTPTAAAEFAVPVRADLEATLAHYQVRLPQALRHRVQRQKEKLVWLGRNLPDPRRVINHSRQRLDDIEERFARAMQQRCKNLQETLWNKKAVLENLSPQKTLERGYIYATDSNGDILKSATTKTTEATLHFHDGERVAELKDA